MDNVWCIFGLWVRDKGYFCVLAFAEFQHFCQSALWPYCESMKASGQFVPYRLTVGHCLMCSYRNLLFQQLCGLYTKERLSRWHTWGELSCSPLPDLLKDSAVASVLISVLLHSSVTSAGLNWGSVVQTPWVGLQRGGAGSDQETCCMAMAASQAMREFNLDRSEITPCVVHRAVSKRNGRGVQIRASGLRFPKGVLVQWAWWPERECSK